LATTGLEVEPSSPVGHSEGRRSLSIADEDLDPGKHDELSE
jgi:hypothetical protein